MALALYGEWVVGLRLCIPSAVVPAVGRREQNLGGEITIRFGANGVRGIKGATRVPSVSRQRLRKTCMRLEICLVER